MRLFVSLLRTNRSTFRRSSWCTPPNQAHPTKSFTERFHTTPVHRRYQPPKRKPVINMASGMTTKNGQPFDRAALEQLMKVGAFLCTSES